MKLTLTTFDNGNFRYQIYSSFLIINNYKCLAMEISYITFITFIHIIVDKFSTMVIIHIRFIHDCWRVNEDTVFGSHVYDFAWHHERGDRYVGSG